MPADVVRIALEPLKVKLAVIVEADVCAVACDPVQNPVNVFYLPIFPFLPFSYNRLLRRRQNTIEAPEHGHRQHHALVLRWPVRAAQQVGDGPDEVGKLLKGSGHIDGPV